MSFNQNSDPLNGSGSKFFDQKPYEPKPIPEIKKEPAPAPARPVSYEDPDKDRSIAGVIVPLIAVFVTIIILLGLFFFTHDLPKGTKLFADRNATATNKRDRDRDRDDDDDDDDDDNRHSGGAAANGGIIMPGESDLDAALDQQGAGTGEITISLIWYNSDDVDLHVSTPSGELYYGNRYVGGGTLDVDANAEVMMDSPVENIYFAEPQSGEYHVWIEDFTDRNDGYTGYLVRVTVGGVSRLYEGHIDGTGTDIDIITFGY